MNDQLFQVLLVATGQTLYIDGGASMKKYPELFTFFGVETAG